MISPNITKGLLQGTICSSTKQRPKASFQKRIALKFNSHKRIATLYHFIFCDNHELKLMLSNLSSDITQKQIEQYFKHLSLQVGCAMVESVSVIAALKMAYVVFPSIISAQTIYRVNIHILC